MKTTAIILAAGQGKRMNSDTAKQYLLIHDKPVLYYSLKAFEDSEIDEIILVVQPGMKDYVIDHILKPYGFLKVTKIVDGGAERYLSVYEGLKAIDETDYVLIHDGARPFVSCDMIHRIINAIIQYKACVVGMPVKDTIKIVDSNGVIIDTPDRDKVWMIQTPQGFEYSLVFSAYNKLLETSCIQVTDDAMVVEKMLSYPVHTVYGSYENIKITTPEDIEIANSILRTIG